MSLAYKIVQDGLVDKQALEEAKRESLKSGKSYWVELIKLGHTTERQLAIFFSNTLKIPLVDLDQYIVHKDVLGLVSEETLRKYMVMPVFRIEGLLGLGMANPGDVIAIDEISRMTSLAVEPLLCTLSDIRKQLDKYYGSEDFIAHLAEFTEANFSTRALPPQDTRVDRRVRMVLPVEIAITSPEISALFETETIEAQSVDISAGGMQLLFKWNSFLPRETHIRLSIIRDGARRDYDELFQQETSLALSAKIVSFQGMEGPLYKLGASFVDIPGQVQHRIREFVERKFKESEG
ncbi:MAG: PilZ domain-containing protein [Candidatus Omnitrophica bacterium]|nr:PilZ domain-containing protein [Candidatus Omnitrophota bacterium]